MAAVADTDDYFDYEQPLDFVTRAERKKLLKEAKGDEKLANQILMERTGAQAGDTVATEVVAATEPEVGEQSTVEGAMEKSPENDTTAVEEAEIESVTEVVEAVTSKVEHVEEPKATPPEKKKVPEKPSPMPASKIVEASDDELDILGI
jgi:hypothetical protein